MPNARPYLLFRLLLKLKDLRASLIPSCTFRTSNPNSCTFGNLNPNSCIFRTRNSTSRLFSDAFPTIPTISDAFPTILPYIPRDTFGQIPSSYIFYPSSMSYLKSTIYLLFFCNLLPCHLSHR